MPVTLTDADIIGRGMRRVCYSYPGDPARCIKILRAHPRSLGEQRRELRAYRSIRRRGIPYECVPRYHGVVSTSLGEGHVYDAIRDADGRVSGKLAQYVEEAPERVEEYRRLLRELERYFLENLVVFCDLNPHNILCRQNASGRLHPVVIDGLGDNTRISVLNRLPVLARRKIRRRWRRLSARLERDYEWMKPLAPDV